MNAIVGMILSSVAARTVSNLLFGLSPYDPATLLGAAAVLAIICLFAGLQPAWRAANVSPTEALRVE